MLREWILEEYNPGNREEVVAAMRQVMQQIALAGLFRAGFFEHAAFYGGTALRIFYQLPRFSEDLDFSLLQPNPDFSLARYVKALEQECLSLGIDVTVRSKKKARKSNIDSAFVNTTTRIQELLLQTDQYTPGRKEQLSVKIKLEVDIDPPLGFDTEERLMLKPYSCYIKCFTPEDLMAGKLHALLFRRWKNRVKGRDWFDLEWYIRRGTEVNLSHLNIRARHSGDWTGEKSMNRADLMALLKERIHEIDFEQAKRDVRRFLEDPSGLEMWSSAYFIDLIKHLQVKEQ